MSGPLFFNMVFDAVLIALCLFQSESVRNIHALDPGQSRQFCGNILIYFQAIEQRQLNIIFAFNAGVSHLIMMWICCHFADHVTRSNCFIAETLYKCQWIRMPIDLQRTVLLCMRRAQYPVYFTGLGFIQCSLENCAKVSETI